MHVGVHGMQCVHGGHHMMLDDMTTTKDAGSYAKAQGAASRTALMTLTLPTTPNPHRAHGATCSISNMTRNLARRCSRLPTSTEAVRVPSLKRLVCRKVS